MNLTNELKMWLLLKQSMSLQRALVRGLTEQNLLLKRIADSIAPEVVAEPVEQSVRSVDYSEDHLQAVLIEFSERRLRDLGRQPTDEEMIEFLDELAERTEKARS